MIAFPEIIFARKRELHREVKRFLDEEKLMKAWQILLLGLQGIIDVYISVQ